MQTAGRLSRFMDDSSAPDRGGVAPHLCSTGFAPPMFIGVASPVATAIGPVGAGGRARIRRGGLGRALVAILLAWAAWPREAGAQYTHKIETWTATTADTWETQSLSGAPYSVPANAVVEVAVRNGSSTDERSGGVRAVGSALERRFLLHDAEDGGVEVVVMHVQTNASSQIQHYADTTADVDFVLLGYWTSGTYVERFDTFTAGANASWQDRNLCTYGVGPEHVAELVMTNDALANGREAGVRTNGSALERRLDLQEAEDGGVDTATMFVKADATIQATIELYAQTNSSINFYLVGYWNVAPLAYTQLFADIGNPTMDGAWEDIDLTASGVPNGAIAEMNLGNKQSTQNLMGVRENGSALDRRLDLMDAETGGNWGRMHVDSDASAIIEFNHQDVSDTYDFQLVGYWDSCNSSIKYSVADLGAITGANKSLGWHINSTRKVAGFEEDVLGAPDAWFHDCGTFTALGTLGGADGEAHGINNNNMVVGWAHDASAERRAFSWTSGGGMVNLGTASGRDDSEALSVNANSEIVGTVVDFDPAPPRNRLAFIYLPVAAYTLGVGMTSLGTLGGAQSVGMDINDSGQVTGGAMNASGVYRPFRWANGTMTDLGTLGGDNKSVDHRGEAINSSGDVAGRSYTAGNAKHAFFYSGSMTDLGVLTGGTQSWAFGVNDSDIVVGTSDTTGAVFRAFVWDSTNGMRNLNSLISGSSGWTLLRATDINNDGFITGWGTNGSGNTRAFLLTPTCGNSGGGSLRSIQSEADVEVAAAQGGGGGGAVSSSLISGGVQLTDADGTLVEMVVDNSGTPLAGVELVTDQPGVSVEYEVSESVTLANPDPGTSSETGFADGVALARTLRVSTGAAADKSSVTVSMRFTRDEIAGLEVDPYQLQLHVFNSTDGQSTGVWVAAGENVGESTPTAVIGQTGFFFSPDDTVDYWAVLDDGGTFAVGMPLDALPPPPPPTCSPGLCGVACLQALLACTSLLLVYRSSVRRRRATAL